MQCNMQLKFPNKGPNKLNKQCKTLSQLKIIVIVIMSPAPMNINYSAYGSAGACKCPQLA